MSLLWDLPQGYDDIILDMLCVTFIVQFTVYKARYRQL